MESLEDIGFVAASLPNTPVTLLFPHGALTGVDRSEGDVELGTRISLGLSLADARDLDESSLRSHLGSFSRSLARLTGVQPEYVRLDPAHRLDVRAALKPTGYRSCLDGTGRNRPGDPSGFLRLLDVTEIAGSPSLANLKLRVCVGLFKGRYGWWPVAALMRFAGRLARVS
jgi:hypothetical protein